MNLNFLRNCFYFPLADKNAAEAILYIYVQSQHFLNFPNKKKNRKISMFFFKVFCMYLHHKNVETNMKIVFLYG